MPHLSISVILVVTILNQVSLTKNRNMKNLLNLLLATSLTFAVSAGNELPLTGLKKEIGKKMIIDLSKYELNEEEIVDVQFEIVKNEIQIRSISGAKRALMDLIKNKLESIKLDNQYQENQVYKFRFTFEKEQ